LTAYRIYLVGAAGRLRLGDVLQADDDAAAIAAARAALPAGQAAELWQGGRIVGRFSRSGAFAPGRDGGG
jgi:hypothetical protein